MSVEVNPGYKLAEVGVIPEDWVCTKLSRYVTFKTGPFGSTLHKSDYVDGGVPVINPMQIISGKLEPTKNMTISEDAARRLSDFRLCAGNVVIGRRGEMGRCAFVNKEQVGWLCGTGSMIIRPSSMIDGRFLQRMLSSSKVITAIANASVGSTMINLNQGTLGNLSLAIPPTKAEQQSIAEALSDADALIESLEQLITKKSQIKQGAMQKLLNPKDGWEKVKLGSLGVFLKGSGVKRDESLSGNIPCIRYGEIYTKHKDYIKAFDSWISSEVAATATRIKCGDILFAGSGETKEEIGKCVAFVDDIDAYAGGDIVILRPNNANSLFLGCYLNTESVNRQKASKGQGDAVVHIGSNALADIDLIIPPVEEQAVVASVLFDMDAEIGALEAKLEKIRQLKQGMMYNLLTGKIRMV
ncbi:MAG: restriction endonuclease subunit S [Chlorobiaceae bacterium]